MNAQQGEITIQQSNIFKNSGSLKLSAFIVFLAETVIFILNSRLERMHCASGIPDNIRTLSATSTRDASMFRMAGEKPVTGNHASVRLIIALVMLKTLMQHPGNK